jgi:bifunctional non-homologous end joining protein LigD
MRERLDKIERRTSPFQVAPRTNEPAHWVAPKLVVEVKFAEWTSDGRLRQPIFLGVRDDKAARDVTIEGVSMQRWGTGEIANDAA